MQDDRRQLRNLLDNLPGVAYRCGNDSEWSMEFISQGSASLTGYQPHELVDNRVVSYASLIHADDRSRVWEAVQAAVQQSQPFRLEYRIFARDGTEKWVWEQGVGVRDGEESLLALEGVILDITDRKRAEERHTYVEKQMRAAQRMESVGQLAGGIAHDFNNLLTVILAYASFLRERFENEPEPRADADAIIEAVRRAAKLTSQLLAFGRRQLQELQILDLNSVITDLGDMLEPIIGDDVELVRKLGKRLWNVKADHSQLEQIIMNLVVNARDAMPEGGRITIETANVEVDEPYQSATGVTVPQGRYVEIAVSDTGTGMSRETQARIFEPFYTTKEVGRGTGLGLSTVYGIVRQSDGFLWVYSELGTGSTFKIVLPRAEGEPQAARRRRSAFRSLRGTEVILLVDDEPKVREVTARILRRHGYRVIEAGNGAEAVTAQGQHTERIDLLMTDTVMPEMGGPALAEMLSRAQPELRVLFMSGYAKTATAPTHPGPSHFLAKPFTTRELLTRVREALGRG